jgi:hypothetical protein
MVKSPATCQTGLAFLIGCRLLLVDLPAWALEYTADQVTKIDGRTHKANI